MTGIKHREARNEDREDIQEGVGRKLGFTHSF